jgi:hypothetical protein
VEKKSIMVYLKFYPRICTAKFWKIIWVSGRTFYSWRFEFGTFHVAGRDADQYSDSVTTLHYCFMWLFLELLWIVNRNHLKPWSRLRASVHSENRNRYLPITSEALGQAMNFLDLTNIRKFTECRKEENKCFIIKSRQLFLGHGVCLLLEAGKRIYGNVYCKTTARNK